MSFDRDIMQEYAVLSDISYKRTIRGRENELDSQGLSEWMVDDELTNKNQTVMINETDGRVVMSIRGTDLKNFDNAVEDIFNDGLIAINLQRAGSRYKKSQKALDKLISKYGEENVVLTGHSAGGRYAQCLAKMHKPPLESHVFNPGTSAIAARQGIHAGLAKPPKEIRDNIKKNNVYLTGNDIISQSSAFNPYQTTHIIGQHGSNPHSIGNFIRDPIIGPSPTSGGVLGGQHLGSHMENIHIPPAQTIPFAPGQEIAAGIQPASS